tara:strand:- start:67 stop:228 length:162 start_codon:yes stop_codon:yes gene_type:complete
MSPGIEFIFLQANPTVRQACIGISGAYLYEIVLIAHNYTLKFLPSIDVKYFNF